MSQPRLASEVILELEQKINNILNIVQALDLNIKIISNKLNSINISANSGKIDQPQYSASLPEDDDPKHIKVPASNPEIIDPSKISNRRGSRHEVYDNSKPEAKIKEPEIIVPINQKQEIIVNQSNQSNQKPIENAIPIMQRIIDKNGKSIFLANIEILDAENGSLVYKTRTNGTGKWMASLAPMKYKVLTSKLEQLTKEKITSLQEIIIDGKTSPLQLPDFILK